MTHAVASLLSSLAWTAPAVLCIWRLDRFAHRWLDRSHPVVPAHPSEAVTVPDDLAAFALAETEKWAQDQTLAAIRERYEKYKDWNKVRHALGVGEVVG